MKNVTLIFLLLCFSCKTDKEESVNSMRIEKVEAKKDSIFSDTKEKNKTEKVKDSILRPNKGSYSMTVEDVKNKQDSASFLKHYYKQFQSLNDSISEKLYFKLFPDSFDKFISLYGYKEAEGDIEYGLLYDDYDQIIGYSPKYIEEKEYIKKLYSIAKDGHWQADNVNFLQERIRDMFLNKPPLFFEILNEKKAESIFGFWVFFFDGPNPNNQNNLFKNVVNQLEESKNNEMIPIVKKAFRKVERNWKK